jgi:NHL repeat
VGGPVWLAVAACILVGAACSPAQRAGQAATPFAHLQVAPTMRSYHVPSQIGLVTSIAQDALGRTLLCDHSRLYVVARTATGYSVAEVPRPVVPAWQPTGLAYQNGLLYVADGPARDVLVLRLTGTRLDLVRRITSQLLGSPQSVAVESDGSMVVADQGGGSLLKFSAQGDLLWQRPLASAHGVVESGGAIFATSLQQQGPTLSRWTLSGQRAQVGGAIGVSDGRFLRPAGLASDGGRILVTDAYNGRVTVLDGGLHVVAQVGGNGPGVDAFDIPTATLPVDGGYLVADSYRGRLVRTDRRWVIQEQIVFGPMVPTGRQRPLVFGSDAQPFTYGMLPGVDIAASLGLRRRADFAGAWDGLDRIGGGSPGHLSFDDTQMGASGPTWAQQVGRYVVAGSPTSPRLEVIDPATAMFTYVDVGLDSWWRPGWLLLPGNFRRPLDEVVAPAVSAFEAARQLLAQGVSRQDAFTRALAAGPWSWQQELTSAPAQQFLRSPMTPADAARYFDAALRQRDQRVVELLGVKYLSGA